ELPVILLRTGRERQPLVPATYYVMQAEENFALAALIERLVEGQIHPLHAQIKPDRRRFAVAS
ncbi:MAG TPA: hypothetical protein VFZ99_01715, partial [Terriglobales bacterium]